MNFISAVNIDEASKTVDESRGWVIGLMSRSSLHEIIKTIPEDSEHKLDFYVQHIFMQTSCT